MDCKDITTAHRNAACKTVRTTYLPSLYLCERGVCRRGEPSHGHHHPGAAGALLLPALLQQLRRGHGKRELEKHFYLVFKSDNQVFLSSQVIEYCFSSTNVWDLPAQCVGALVYAAQDCSDCLCEVDFC